MAAMFGNIKADHLFFLANPQANGHFYNREQDECATEGPDKGSADTGQLCTDDLGGDAFNIEKTCG